MLLIPSPRILFAALVLVVAAPAAAQAALPALAECEDVPVAGFAAPLLAPPAGGACGGIRPGAHMDAPSGCTYNFVFEDAEARLYIGTAGHCVSHVGERVSADGIGEFGTVVFAVANDVGEDFGLIRIDESRYGEVNPQMCHWGGPTGMDPASAAFGVPLKQFGHGLVLGQNDATRAREGALASWAPTYWRAALPVTGGDSGSPMILADGRAGGVVTHASVSFSSSDLTGAASTSAGTRISHGIAMAEAATGLDLALVTAPLLDA